MSKIEIKLDGRHVFGSGVIVGKIGQSIEITPFPEQPGYTLKVNVSAAPEGTTNRSDIRAEGAGVVIDHAQEWNVLSNETIVTHTIFGGDESKLYVINYSVRFRGRIENYSYIFSFTLYVEPTQ